MTEEVKKYEKVLSEIEDELYGLNIFYPGLAGELPLGSKLYEFFKLTRLEDRNYQPEDLAQGLLAMIKSLILRTNQYLIWEDIATYLDRRVYKFFLDLENLDFSSQDYDLELKNLHNNLQTDIITYLSRNEELKSMDQGRKELEVVPCSQYSGQHQLDILAIELEDLKEPILDIGSGYDGNLVEYLRSKGFEAYGFDRMVKDSDYLFTASWLDYNFQETSWGTIISHLAFSNHFKREHLKVHGRHIEYAKKYMEILGSLKEGASFYYSPSLDFIEELLPEEDYELIRKPISSGYLRADTRLYSTRIVKKITYL